MKYFIKRPNMGDVVKVYTGDQGYKFGKVIGIKMGFCRDKNETPIREKVELEELTDYFEVLECDFCLTSGKCEFVKVRKCEADPLL